MAELSFAFGTMGAGKSTMALQIAHNLRKAGCSGVLFTQLDRRGAHVSSQLGVKAAAIEIDDKLNLRDLADEIRARDGSLDFIVCDEAQFYSPDQIDQLASVVDDLGADVYAFGLLTDFRGRLFPGTQRLLELSDRCEELQIESRCWCGRRATHNARLLDGIQVYDGELLVVDDPTVVPSVSYELRCRMHWHNCQG
ncbi:MAG: thymidine kinase, partial [Acidobacteria bacterium]|nr:thymidine kinase [Acidobacteriota bacterium]